MTSIYLPQPIFSNILTFCDDRIERRQKMLHRNLIQKINHYANLGYDSFPDYLADLYDMTAYDDTTIAEELHYSWIIGDFS